MDNELSIDYSNKIPRCQAGVQHRDTYRYSGGKQGFTLQYKIKQCTRKATSGSDFCTQHHKHGEQIRLPQELMGWSHYVRARPYMNERT